MEEKKKNETRRPVLTGEEKASIGMHMFLTECIDAFLRQQFGIEYIKYMNDYSAKLSKAYEEIKKRDARETRDAKK